MLCDKEGDKRILEDNMADEHDDDEHDDDEHDPSTLLSLEAKRRAIVPTSIQKSKVFQKFTSQVRSPRPPKNEVKTEQTGAKVKQREREREREREGVHFFF